MRAGTQHSVCKPPKKQKIVKNDESKKIKSDKDQFKVVNNIVPKTIDQHADCLI